ncbi:bifunctional 3-(3-hydroxy-phenyl)propionate/3-hydroxycinnamic acid hydroxylase, partial [Streptomyces sp. SID9944]|nr:bifunctional 3-(3-hydroxy-phenyl)propionate/3-hydroxycinnamic acid hydroxylase [Streptomyces sp. SID9944]
DADPAAAPAGSVVDTEGGFAAYLHEVGARCVLVRPDAYAFGAADGAEGARELVDALSDALAEAGRPVPAAG